jgi:hypothetical protein
MIVANGTSSTHKTSANENTGKIALLCKLYYLGFIVGDLTTH